MKNKVNKFKRHNTNSFLRRGQKLSFYLNFTILLTVGCASHKPTVFYKDISKGLGKTIQTSPSLSEVYVQDLNDRKIICLGRGADTAFEVSDGESLNIGFVLPISGDKASEAGVINEFAGEEEMLGRTAGKNFGGLSWLFLTFTSY